MLERVRKKTYKNVKNCYLNVGKTAKIVFHGVSC